MKENKTFSIQILVESVIVAVLIFITTITGTFQFVDFMLKDALYQIPRGVDNEIKIIAIDEKTLEEYGPIGTWSRSVYADIISVLNSNAEAKPSVIGFDVLFSGNVDEGDQVFADAARESGNVVTVSTFVYGTLGHRDENNMFTYPIEDMIMPYQALRDVVYTGFSNVSQDTDSMVRRISSSETFNNQETRMFSWVIYNLYCQNKGLQARDVATDAYGKTLINYSGKPGDYEAISMSDLLAGKIDSRVFKDCIILVGAYAPGMQDNFNVPNGGSDQMYGVEIHANIVQSFLDGRFAVTGNPYVYGALMAVLGFLVYYLIRRFKVVAGTIIFIASVIIELIAGVLLNKNGICISLVYYPLILFVAYVYSIILKYVVERRKKKLVLGAFKKYVAPEIIEEISKRGDFEVALGVRERDIAVLFVDIRGFTTMSEGMEPGEVVKILNEYLALTTKAVFDNKGTLDKFVGDATMAVFNSPIDLDDYEYRAVKAALDIVKGGEALEKVLLEKYGRTVGFGVGVHCGKAVVGNVGCDFRMDYTAIGDTVNTSARLEANAKKGQVLISEELYGRLKSRIDAVEVPPIALKGKSNTFTIYEVHGIK